jgi:glycosyltransferase involved in cell wall biosynthesis
MCKQYQYTFTVFTPTFNRAHTLTRVYCSLKRQTFKDFEWLIIDDGSSDHTYELVMSWKNEASFEIRYYQQENSGKHIAINRALKLAKGEYFLIADSDDSFLSCTLERFYFHWNSLHGKERDDFFSIACHCIDSNGKLIGRRFPFDPTDSNSEEILYRYKVSGEKWGVQRTEVLIKYPFPEINTICFPEFYIWRRIAKKYKIRFVNECFRIYHQDAGDQLMKQTIDDFSSRSFYYVDSLNTSAEWIKYAPLRFLKDGIQYVRLSLWRHDSFLTQWKKLKKIAGKLIWFISIVPGFFLWQVDKIKNRMIGGDDS